MLKTLFTLLLALQTMLAAPAECRTVFAMKTGVLLRVHVVAQDDTAEMQRVKLCVRDAVLAAYAAAPEDGQTMLRRAEGLMPELTSAAVRAARDEGFTGAVEVSLEQAAFDSRTLDGITIPAGEYPALMIRLGDARGHNWWGLLDPQLALDSAAARQGDGPLVWDWSLSALLEALLMPFITIPEEVACP